jgi:hypothetical protein
MIGRTSRQSVILTAQTACASARETARPQRRFLAILYPGKDYLLYAFTAFILTIRDKSAAP